jgi:hypothetical protein
MWEPKITVQESDLATAMYTLGWIALGKEIRPQVYQTQVLDASV